MRRLLIALALAFVFLARFTRVLVRRVRWVRGMAESLLDVALHGVTFGVPGRGCFHVPGRGPAGPKGNARAGVVRSWAVLR
jgi:hypothetical protein